MFRRLVCRILGHDWVLHRWSSVFAPGRIYYIDRVAHDCRRCGAFAYLPLKES